MLPSVASIAKAPSPLIMPLSVVATVLGAKLSRPKSTVPVMFMSLATVVTEALKRKPDPLANVTVPVPKALLWPRPKVPALTVVLPTKLFAAKGLKRPAPVLVKSPVPVMLPL